MDLLGAGYLTDCVIEAMRERHELENYRIYVTDRLYTLCGWSGNAPRLRYYDALYPAPEDRRTGEEIARERLSTYGIKVV